MINETEIVELFDKYLLGHATEEERGIVKDLINRNNNLQQVFDFRRSFVGAVRQNKSEELRNRFKMLESELEQEMKEPVRAGESNTKVLSLYPKKWLWAAAVLLFGIGSLVFFNQRSVKQDIAIGEADSLNGVKTDSVKELERPVERNIAEHKITPIVAEKMERVVQLPFYESLNGSLGFGKNDRPSDSVTAQFIKSDKQGYDYGDTLKIYLSRLPSSVSTWRVVYDKSEDIYYLNNQSKKYELNRDKGFQILKIH